MLIVADALHAQLAHATDLHERGAHLMVTVKANQPTLLRQLKTLPWPQVSIGHRTRDRDHGRRETRTLKAVTVAIPQGLGFPHAAQAVRITRREWHIENRLHWIRDVTLHEDVHQARTGNGPAIAAVLRNTTIGYHRIHGETNIARATRRADRRPDDLVTAVTSTNPTTQ